MSDILLIEDDPANRKLVRGILERADHSVRTAENAEDGLICVEDQLPALVVMDVQLPGMDGLSATQRIKSQESTSDIAVLVLTAHAMEGDRDRIMASGCDAYMSKPVRYRELLTQVDALLEQQEGDGHE